MSKQLIVAEWRRAAIAQAAVEALLDARLPEDAAGIKQVVTHHAISTRTHVVRDHFRKENQKESGQKGG